MTRAPRSRAAPTTSSTRARPGAAALLAQRIAELASVEPPVPATDRFVAASDAARAVLREVAQAARTSMPVLLTGETGTGKEVAARLLHALVVARATRSFVPINCAAIPNELIEAELFGYAQAARSPARCATYDGQLTAAAGGTVFLDEVDDTPLPLQVKLLRVLEDRVVSRLGENEWRRGRLPHRRRHQPRSARAGRARRVRRRSLRAPGDRRRSGCRRCASGSTISPRSSPHFIAPVLPRGAGATARHKVAARRRPRWRRSRAIRGRATSASCAT